MEFLTNIPWISNFLLPATDIIILAFLLFKTYRLFEDTRAVQLLQGALILATVYAVSWILQLSTLLWILGKIAPGIFIVLAIIFQPELRSIFVRIGQQDFFRGKARQHPFQADIVLNAAEVLASHRRGALIVLMRTVRIKNIIDTGTLINAHLSSAIIITIFGHDGPLHDGAVVVDSGQIKAAGCFLPLSKEPDILRSFGTRHRAALGLAEETDAVILAVSEETGALSLAYDGNIFYDLESEEISHRLNELMGENAIEIRGEPVV